MKQVTLIRLEGVEASTVQDAIDKANEMVDGLSLVCPMEPEAAYGFVAALLDQLARNGMRLKEDADDRH